MQSVVLTHTTPLAAMIGSLPPTTCSAVDSVRATLARWRATLGHATGSGARLVASLLTFAPVVSSSVAAAFANAPIPSITETPLLKFGPGGDHVESLFGLASTDCTLLLRSRGLERLPSRLRPEPTPDKHPSAPTVATALRELRARGLSVASASEAGDRLLAIRDLRALDERIEEQPQPAARGVMAVARIRAATDAWRRRHCSVNVDATAGMSVTDGTARSRRGESSRRSRRATRASAICRTTLFDTVVTDRAPSAAVSSTEPSDRFRSHHSGS